MKQLIAFIVLICLPSISPAAVSQIAVPVTISYQGRSVSTVMAVDTGATITTIDTALADRLGVVTATGSGRAQMADGQTVRYYSAPMDVQVSSYRRDRLQVNVMDYAGAREGVHGMLGLNFLEGMVLTIDWKSRRIYWSE